MGDLLRDYPEVRGKVRELFGEECLQCRSNRQETVTYTAWHRGLDPERVCRELNALVRKAKGRKAAGASTPEKGSTAGGT
ncbi:MAG: hypothetical protein Kow00128_20890 [Deltaproteobacteria bacterium]